MSSECIPLQRFTDDDEEMVIVERLGQKVVRAFFHGFDGGLNGSMCGHDNDRRAVRRFHLS